MTPFNPLVQELKWERGGDLFSVIIIIIIIISSYLYLPSYAIVGFEGGSSIIHPTPNRQRNGLFAGPALLLLQEFKTSVLLTTD